MINYGKTALDMNVINHPSPNFNDRHLPLSMLVMHYTGMESGTAAIERLCDREARVSAHYVVEEDGCILQLVEENKRAWHAGSGYWRGCTDVNAASVGIEIVNGGHDFGLPDFPEVQIRAVMALCQSILGRHPIRARDVIGHSDLAPDRKQDPGEKFPWERLAREGIGLWPEPARPVSELTSEQLADLLGTIGYGVGGASGFTLETVLTAFQRRYRFSAVTGRADAHTQALIVDLARKVRYEA